MDNILSNLSLIDELDVQRNLAQHLLRQRKAKHLSRQQLAIQSNVPASTIKRFEHTGEISLRQFLRLWLTLDELSRLNDLTQRNKQIYSPKTIEEIVNDDI